jgi:hypothetical protein
MQVRLCTAARHYAPVTHIETPSDTPAKEKRKSEGMAKPAPPG